MTRIGVIKPPESCWSGAAEQTVEYLYSRCRKVEETKEKAGPKARKKGIITQPQVESIQIDGRTLDML